MWNFTHIPMQSLVIVMRAGDIDDRGQRLPFDIAQHKQIGDCAVYRKPRLKSQAILVTINHSLLILAMTKRRMSEKFDAVRLERWRRCDLTRIGNQVRTRFDGDSFRCEPVGELLGPRKNPYPITLSQPVSRFLS